MLAHAGRPARDLPVGLGEVHRQPVDAHVAHLLVVHGGPQPPGLGVGTLVDALLRPLHGGRGDAALLQLARRLELVVAPRPDGDDLVELVLAFESRIERGQCRVGDGVSSSSTGTNS